MQRELRQAGVEGELLLTGALSVKGVLTKGDIDLHLRVNPRRFSAVVSRLCDLYEPVSRAVWAETLCVFAVPGDRPTGLAVTPTGSEHDRYFTRTWELLRTRPELLCDYNNLKKEAYGDPSYDDRKAVFFFSIAGGST